MAQQVFPSPPTGNQPVSSQASVDAVLVKRSLRGDGDAFAALFDRHAPRVYALAYQLLGDRAEAEDITQDAFLQALSALPTLRQPETFGAWVARIATNASLSTLRRRGRLPQAELSEAVTATYPDPARWSSPEAMGLATEERHSVHVTLKRLAPSHRAALAMRKIGGLSYAEIARALGTTAGGVEALLFRARARFRDEYHKVALGAATAQTTTCTCQQAQEALAALADNALAEPRRMEVVSHVRHCDACTATLQAQRDARRLIVAVPLFVPSAIKLATMAKVGPLLSLYAIGGAAAGGAATAGMATSGAATAGMATSGAATAGMAAGGAASSGAAVAGGAVAGGAAATGLAATSRVPGRGGPSKARGGLAAPTVGRGREGGGAGGRKAGPPGARPGATARAGSPAPPAVTPSLGAPSLATGQATVVAAPSATTTVPATVA